MAVITFPSNFVVAKFAWGQQRRDLSFNSIFGSQSMEVSDPLWTASVTPVILREADSGAWQAFMLSLKGQTNQVELWNLARPAPLGTMRGTMTLNGPHEPGATSLNISASGQGNKTLKQGDTLGLGIGTARQVVMVTEDATADGTGNITVAIQPSLRTQISSGASVTWDKPKALFRQQQVTTSWDYEPGKMVSGFALDLVEDWRSA